MGEADRTRPSPRSTGAPTSRPPARPSKAGPGTPATLPYRLASLQRSVGNRAVGELVGGAGGPELSVSRTVATEQRPVLFAGWQGPSVEAAQQFLNEAGADPQLDTDGIFGALTDTAVRSFQAEHRLDTDGIVGAKTWAALRAPSAPPTETEQPATGTEPSGSGPSGTTTGGGAGTGAGTATGSPGGTAPATSPGETSTVGPTGGGSGAGPGAAIPGAELLGLLTPEVLLQLPLRAGSTSSLVGMVQQKLNAAGAEPLVRITARYSTETESAVRAFQAKLGFLPQTGEVDAFTYLWLDLSAPGGHGGAPVTDPGGGDPNARPKPGTSDHPTLDLGSRGVAVAELKQKLNRAGQHPPLTLAAVPENEVFDDFTRDAVIAFKERSSIAPPSGVADAGFWARLDAVAPGSTVGRVERDWDQVVHGETTGMVSSFTWKIDDSAIRTTVNFQFVGDTHAFDPQWFTDIRAGWNVFKAVDRMETPPRERDIVFEPQQATPADIVVRITHVPPGDPTFGTHGSNAGEYFTDDPNMAGMLRHEFGHAIGLEDEYGRGHRDYTRLTGEQPSVGDVPSPSGASASDIAAQINTALQLPVPAARGLAAATVVQTHQLNQVGSPPKQGAFSQEVAAQYLANFKVDIVEDLRTKIPKDAEGAPTSAELFAMDPFLYETTSTMGNFDRDPNHTIEARHVRQWVGYVQSALGGHWEAEKK